MTKWHPRSKRTALIAIGVPIAATALFTVQLLDLGAQNYWRLISSDLTFATSQVLMLVALCFWLWRYTLPAVSLFANEL